MTKDMTNGSPMKLILSFSIPLLFGFLFQQFYNVVDTIIVGRFLGVGDLASVGATGSINFLIIGFCLGVCSGFAIPVAQRFGAKDYTDMRKFVANCIWLTAIFAIVMTVITTCLCKQILILMKTPEDIIDGAYRYIWVIFLGIPATYLYNMLSGIIRALGDSKTPLIFLIISSFLNIGLDLVFIINFKLGVAGAAWATVVSQAVSGILCLVYVCKKVEILHLKKEELEPDKHKMAILCNMGIPMGLQYSITAIGSVILQSATNTLGSVAVASTTAGGRISGFMASPFDAMGSTMATYAGQNIGANKIERVGKGMKSCVIIGAVYSVLALAVSLCFSEQLGMLFVDAAETEILANVRIYLVTFTAFYFPLALVNIIRFTIQGVGFPRFAILAGVFEMVARALSGVFLVPKFGFLGACLGSPLAWILADMFLIPAYFHVINKLKKIMGGHYVSVEGQN